MESIKEKTARILKGLEQIKVIMRETRHDLEKINNIESRLKDLENTASAMNESISATNGQIAGMQGSIDAADEVLSRYSLLCVERIAEAVNEWCADNGPYNTIEETLLWLMSLVKTNSDEINELRSRVETLDKWTYPAKVEALRTIGYNDEDIEDCIAYVPDLTPQDIAQAKAVADTWDSLRITILTDSVLASPTLRLLPSLDMSQIEILTNSFRSIPELRYCPTLNLPDAPRIINIWPSKLRRIPTINAPNLVESSMLYSTTNLRILEKLPRVIRHPKLTRAEDMFSGVGAEAMDYIDDLDINWDIIKNAYRIFGRSGISHIPTFDMPAVTNIASMYNTCKNLGGDYSDAVWNVPENTTIRMMFYECSGITALSLNGLVTAKTTNVEYAFFRLKVNKLVIDNWDLSGLSQMGNAFSECTAEELTWRNIHLPEGWSFGDIFPSMTRLHTLRLPDADFTGTSTQVFNFSTTVNIRNIEGPIKGIDFDVNLQRLTQLTSQSALVIIDGLAQTTNRRRLTLPSMAYDGLTPEQIAVATSKGWTVVKS